MDPRLSARSRKESARGHHPRIGRRRWVLVSPVYSRLHGAELAADRTGCVKIAVPPQDVVRGGPHYCEPRRFVEDGTNLMGSKK